jgi:predicted ribonuclease toxin of YeeF-YezG toxin-antitoxin module
MFTRAIADQGEEGNDKKRQDRELEKLRQLDPALAKEMEEYRRNYEGGLMAEPIEQ